MDIARFDRLTRNLGRTASRRDVSRAVSGLTIAGILDSLFGRGRETAAKKRKRQKKGKKSTGGTTVTRSFVNTLPITINTFGSADPFPSRIQVGGFTDAVITDVDVVLNALHHAVTRHVDVLLVAPDRRNAFVLGDVGSIYAVSGVNLRLDDEADTPLPVGFAPSSGTYQPMNFGDSEGLDAFDTTHAPVPSGVTALSVFDGMDPNGEWQLFIRDDTAEVGGSLAGGWALTITATSTVRKKR